MSDSELISWPSWRGWEERVGMRDRKFSTRCGGEDCLGLIGDELRFRARTSTRQKCDSIPGPLRRLRRVEVRS